MNGNTRNSFMKSTQNQNSQDDNKKFASKNSKIGNPEVKLPELTSDKELIKLEKRNSIPFNKEYLFHYKTEI
jgi:hypothetical protein